MNEFIIATDGSQRSLEVVPALYLLTAPLRIHTRVLSVVPNSVARHQRCEQIGDIVVNGNEIETSIVVEESVSNKLVNIASGYPDTLLALSTHARGAIGESLFGSVGNHVVRNARKPVFLAGPGMATNSVTGLRKILVCLDHSALAETMIEHVAGVARVTGASIWVIQVLTSDTATDPLGAPRTRHEHGHVQRVAQATQKRWDIEVNWEVLHGSSPAHAISNYVRGEQGTLIAMTTHGRSGLNQFVMGSVAQSVVHQAECPVMVMRP